MLLVFLFIRAEQTQLSVNYNHHHPAIKSIPENGWMDGETINQQVLRTTNYNTRVYVPRALPEGLLAVTIASLLLSYTTH